MQRIQAVKTFWVSLAALAAVSMTSSICEGSSHKEDLIDRLSFHFGAGYTEETHDASPRGSIGLQAEANYEIARRWSAGAVLGWYNLGEGIFPEDPPVLDEIRMSVVPTLGQLSYDLLDEEETSLFLNGAGGLYNRIAQGDACDCTDWGVSLGLALFHNFEGNRIAYGLDARYHYLPERGGDDLEYLSILASVRIP